MQLEMAAMNTGQREVFMHIVFFTIFDGLLRILSLSLSRELSKAVSQWSLLKTHRFKTLLFSVDR